MIGKIIANTGWQIGGKVVTVLVSLITTGLLTRKLGTETYGSFVLVTSVFVFLDSLADFGTKIIGVRNISQEGGLKKSRIFWQLVWLRLIMTGLSFLAGLMVVWGWDGFEKIRMEASVALMMIWLTSVAGSWEIRWQVEMRMERKVLAEVLFPLLFLVGMWWYRDSMSLMGVFGGYLVARVISLGVGVWIEGSVEKVVKFDWSKIKRLLSQAWPMGMYLLVFTAYDRAVDSLMIERMLGVREVAWYGLAYKVYSNLVQPAYFLVVSAFPVLSKKIEVKLVFGRLLAILMIGSVALVGLVWWQAEWMVEVLGGSGFGPTVGVLRILSLALVFAYGQHLIGFTVISRGGQKNLLGIGVIVLMFNLVANWWLIPKMGMVGAAWVTVATEAGATVLMGWRLWRTEISEQ